MPYATPHPLKDDAWRVSPLDPRVAHFYGWASDFDGRPKCDADLAHEDSRLVGDGDRICPLRRLVLAQHLDALAGMNARRRGLTNRAWRTRLTVTLDTGTTLRVWLPEARYRSPEDQPSLELMLDFRFHIEDAFRQDFDVLAVCEAPLTGQWRFAFLPFSNVPVPPKPALFDPAGLRDWTREFPGS